MKPHRAPAHGAHRLASPWIRNLLTGEVRREGHRGAVVASVARSPGQQAGKAVSDHRLRASGYLLLDLPGGCIIEKEAA